MDALIPLAISLAPELARFVFGSQSAAIAQSVAQAVQGATGTADDVAAQAVLSRSPQLASQLRAQLAQIAAGAEQATRQAELDGLTSHLKAPAAAGSPQGARAISSRAPLQWAAPVVSLVVLGTFGVVMWAALTRALPAGAETTVNMLLGTLAAMTTSVVSYWVGSSSGSAAKTDLLFRASPPAPGVGPAAGAS